LKIATSLRTIQKLRDGDEDVDIFDLDDLVIENKRDNSIANGTLDTLIRSGAITATTAASLLNDHGYADSIVQHLADAGRILFGDTGIAARDAQELLRFDEDEQEALSLGEKVNE